MTVSDLNPNDRPLSDGEYQNLYDLSCKLTTIEELCPYEFLVNSGFRTHEDQMRVNPKNPKSAHTLGCAVDLEDFEMQLWYWFQDNLDLVRKSGLYLEDEFADTGHVHIQSIPPKSGKTVFEP